jgi:phage terminase large subunit-like protein
VCEARQNGKGEILIARELMGLFLLQEPLIIHSAHQFDTSLEAFRRLLDRIEENPNLERQVKRISRSHGEEGIELKNGSRIRFRTRTKGGGRGFSCYCLILDEAMFLPEMFHGALLPTLSAKSQLENPQVWYTGSAVDQLIHEHGLVFSRIRERGHRGDDPSLAWFEWSVDCSSPDELSDETMEDPEAWAQANPGLGIRISVEHVAKEFRSMDKRTFAVERLGVGDWPRADGLGQMVWSPEQWAALTDTRSKLVHPVVMAFDVTPDRRRASIAAAARNRDGLFHIEVIDAQNGTGWLAERMRELAARHVPSKVVCDGVGPAVSLIHELRELGVDVEPMTTPEHGQACGVIFDAVEQEKLRHLGTPELASAVKGAAQRPLGDAWAWSRKNSATDISPLVACTLALGAFVSQESNPGFFSFA